MSWNSLKVFDMCNDPSVPSVSSIGGDKLLTTWTRLNDHGWYKPWGTASSVLLLCHWLLSVDSRITWQANLHQNEPFFLSTPTYARLHFVFTLNTIWTRHILLFMYMITLTFSCGHHYPLMMSQLVRLTPHRCIGVICPRFTTWVWRRQSVSISIYL